MATLTVTLRNTAPGGTLDRLSLRASYFAKHPTGVIAPAGVTARPDQSGLVTLTLDALVSEREVLVIALLDATATLGQLVVAGSALPNATPFPLDVEFSERTVVAPATTTPETPAFCHGRLLDHAGQADMQDVQIVFYAARDAAATTEPLLSVTTETGGYFFLDYPEGEFTEVLAHVGHPRALAPVTVRLDPSPSGVGLVFPRRLVLVAQLRTDPDDPGPGGATVETAEDTRCGALDMHAGKRVLEQYPFYTLVRTTEPQVRGFVLEEHRDLTLADVLDRHPFRRPELFDAVLTRLTAQGPVLGRAGIVADRSGAGLLRTAAREVDQDQLLKLRLSNSAVRRYLDEQAVLTPDNIVGLLEFSEAHEFRQEVTAPTLNVGDSAGPALGRVVLDSERSVDWDKDPTLYQAVSVAHGHLLHFTTEWVADGYSLGDLLYSLPLAPGQKKQIVVFDWERRESAINVQAVDYEESLYNSLSRDRDIAEITHGAIRENLRGSSKSTTGSASAGIGGLIGGSLFGVSGGVGHSRASSSQDSLRQTSSSDLQKIRDRLTQSANAVRSQRSSVIQTVAQGERFEVSAESVANYNHCHALTIQYFEVLRHFRIRQRFVEAREVLFVPLLLSRFDLDKALRWREALQSAVSDSRLRDAFEAALRVKTRWADVSVPAGTFASEPVLTATGALRVRFVLRRPVDRRIEVDDTDHPIIAGVTVVFPKKTVEDIDEPAWASLQPFLGSLTPREFWEQHLKGSSAKDEVFHRLLGERVAQAFVQSLSVTAADASGASIGALAFDASLASRYRRDGVLTVTLRLGGPTPMPRDRIHYLRVRCGLSVPDNSTIVVEAGHVRYRTAHFEGFLTNQNDLYDDLSQTDSAMLYAGPTEEELRNPRREDVADLNRLLDHLNDNLEPYHRAIWSLMSPDRRFLLLDGIVMPEGSKGAGRSLASLVENELIGIVGNSLVLPVARGLNLDPVFGLKQSLSDAYRVSESEPISVSVPTKGVYAEAMLGACNSCEVKDETRFWRWEESPIPDSPTAIAPVSTDSRRADPVVLQPAPLQNPLIAIQTAPPAPDPTGLAATLGLLAKGDVFRDATGLAQTTTNSLESLKASFDATKSFAQEAAKLETQRMMERRLDTAMKAIDSANHLTPEQRASLAEKSLNAYLGAGPTTQDPDAKKKSEAKENNDKKQAEDISKHLDRVNRSATGEVVVTRPDGSTVKTKFGEGGTTAPLENRVGRGGVQPLRQQSSMACWATVATMMVSWQRGQSMTEESVLALAGQTYVDKYRNNQGLRFTEKGDFIARLGMIGEPPASHAAAAYRDLLLAYGPLWVTVDADSTGGFSAHALVFTGISADLATVEYVNPATGSTTRTSFDAFSQAMADVVRDGGHVPMTQIVHFLAGAPPEETSDAEGAEPLSALNANDPSDGGALVIDTAEFATGITGFTNFKGWKTDSTVPHNRRLNGARRAEALRHIVVHESAADSGDGFDASTNTTSHLSVLRDGTIRQFNDLLELEHHARGLNATGVGIEFVNRGWLSSSTADGGEGIPARQSELTTAQQATYAEANGYLWAFWGYGFNIYRLPPEAQLEKEVELLTWLTDTLSATVAGAPVQFQDMFPTFEKVWLQLVSYDDVSGAWTFPAGNTPAAADRATKNLFVMTTGYGVLEPAQIRSTGGIVSHNATYEGHSDGSFLALYSWLRMAKGKAPADARRLCIDLMKNHWFRATPKGSTEQRVMILDVSDGNL